MGDTTPDDWRYVAEGARNVVVSYIGSNPILVRPHSPSYALTAV